MARCVSSFLIRVASLLGTAFGLSLPPVSVQVFPVRNPRFSPIDPSPVFFPPSTHLNRPIFVAAVLEFQGQVNSEMAIVSSFLKTRSSFLRTKLRVFSVIF